MEVVLVSEFVGEQDLIVQGLPKSEREARGVRRSAAIGDYESLVHHRI